MRQDKTSKQSILLYCLGCIPVIWLGLLVAPYEEAGIVELVRNFGSVMQNPFHIMLCDESLRVVMVLLMAYGLVIGVYISMQRTYRRREDTARPNGAMPQS